MDQSDVPGPHGDLINILDLRPGFQLDQREVLRFVVLPTGSRPPSDGVLRGPWGHSCLGFCPATATLPR